MAKTAYQNINECHEAFDGAIKERMQTIRELVRTIALKAEEVTS